MRVLYTLTLLLFTFFLLGFNPKKLRQTESTVQPSEANTITVEVTFAAVPTAAGASFADMKYNKSAGFLLVKDDGGVGDYNMVFPYLNGGTAVDGVTYPGVAYSDGCGNPVKWKYSFAVVGRDTRGYDAHTGSNETITSWAQYRQMVQAGFCVMNHSLTHGAGTNFYDRLNQVKSNEKLIYDALQYRTRTFVVPASYEGLTETALSLDYRFIGSQFGDASPDGNNDPGNANINWLSRVKVSPIPNLNKLLVSRTNLGDYWTDADLASGRDFVDGIFNASKGTTKYMGHAFSHGPTGSQQMANFMAFIQYIQNHPGNNDRAWIPGVQEFYEYYETKRDVVKKESLSGNTLTITLDLSAINPNNRSRDMSLLVKADAAIASVKVTGADGSSYNKETGLINVFEQKTTGFTDPAQDALPPQLKSVTLNTFAPSEVNLVFDKPVKQADFAGYTVSGQTITGISGSGTTWRLALSGAVTSTKDLTLDYRMQSGKAADASDPALQVCSYIGFPVTVVSVVSARPVSQEVAFSAQPTLDGPVCASGSVTLVSAATGTGSLTYQWQSLSNGNWANLGNGSGISGATTASLNISSPALVNGLTVRNVATVGGNAQSTISNPLTLTVVNGPSITTQPANQQGCLNNSTVFSVAASGSGLLYQWETKESASTGSWTPLKDGGNASGSATAQLTVSGDLIANGRLFRARVSSSICSSQLYSNAATLAVKGPLVFTLQPTSVAICPTGTARFTTGANNNGSGTVSVRWEYYTGSSWVAATGTGFNGGTTGTLYVNGAQLVNGRKFRVVISSTGCPTELASNEVTLSVSTTYAPALTGITPAQTIASGQSIQGITAVSSGGTGTLQTTWSRTNLGSLSFNPALATAGTSADFPLTRTITNASTANQTLTFTLRVADGWGCFQTAQTTVTVRPATAGARVGNGEASWEKSVTVFPNPFDGRTLQVRGQWPDQPQFRLYNTSGVEMPLRSEGAEPGQVQLQIQQRLPSGLYLLKVQQGQRSEYRKVVVE